MKRRKRQRPGLPTYKEPCRMYRDSEIRKIEQERTNEAVVDAFVLMLTIPLMVMKNKYGYGTKRLTEFAEAILDEYKHFENDEMTIDEYRQIAYDLCGFEFRTEE